MLCILVFLDLFTQIQQTNINHMNQLFFNRNIHIEDKQIIQIDNIKQKNQSNLNINKKDEMYCTYNFSPVSNLLKSSQTNESKQYKKIYLHHKRGNQNKMHDEDHRIFLLMRKLETEKLLNKKQKIQQSGNQIEQNQDNQKQKCQMDVNKNGNENGNKNENDSQKSYQVSNYSKSLSKKKNNLNFVRKNKIQKKNKCLSQKCEVQSQKNNQFDQEVRLTKKHQRKLSINIKRQQLDEQKYPRIKMQDQYQKKITQRSIQASPSNKLNRRITCGTCGNFLINMQIFCQKGAIHYKKIKQQLKIAKQINKILQKQILDLKNQIKKQLQNIGISFIKMIKNFTNSHQQYSIKLKTQLNKNNHQVHKTQKLNRSAIFSTHNQFHIPFNKQQSSIFPNKKTQKSQISNKTAGKIKKNYNIHNQQAQSPQVLRIKKKQTPQKFHSLRESLHLQLRNKNMILTKFSSLPLDSKVNLTEINFGKIVSRDLGHTEKQVKSSAPTTDRVNKKQQQIQDEKTGSQSFIKREENYQQCYSNIRDALNKIKLSFL